LGLVGKGGFSQYMQALLLHHPFLISSVSDTSNPYQSDSQEIQTVYICTPDLKHTSILKQALEGRKHHVLCEKPCFLSEADFNECLNKSIQAQLEVQINFQRRFDSLYQTAKGEYLQALADSKDEEGALELRFTSRDPVPHEDDPYKYLHNSVIHDIDSAVWFHWAENHSHHHHQHQHQHHHHEHSKESSHGIVSARVSSLTYSGAPDFALNITLSFTLPGRKNEVHSKISFCKGNKTYVNRIEIIRPGISHKVFEEDFSGSVFFDRYKHAYNLMWDNFHASAQKRIIEGEKDHHHSTINSLSHPSFKFTYQLLDQLLNLCNTTILKH